jgi:hypothetical protein
MYTSSIRVVNCSTDAELAIDNVDPKRPIGIVELISKQDTRYNTPHRARLLQDPMLEGEEVSDERAEGALDERENADADEDQDVIVAAGMFTKAMFGQATTLPPSLRNGPAQQRYLELNRKRDPTRESPWRTPALGDGQAASR